MLLQLLLQLLQLLLLQLSLLLLSSTMLMLFNVVAGVVVVAVVNDANAI